METDGGGWIVFQRRQDGSVDFYRYWTDYENGFGNLTGEFWLGLNKIHRLTKEGSNTLRVDLGDFEGDTAYANYSAFSVGDSTSKYTLTVGGYNGNAGNGFNGHNKMKFTTRDQDNDNRANNNCANYNHEGAWWYHDCFTSHLNGQYLHTSKIINWNGIIWNPWKLNYSLKFTEIKTRRNN